MEAKNPKQFFPPIRGLVLAGGKSTRMGQDKGLLVYHQKPQRVHVYELLRELGLPAIHMSCRPDQEEELTDYHPIPDKAGKAGPIFILAHAFERHPHSAWLIVPCDVPLIDKKTFTFLLSHRDTSKIATAFRSPIDGKPEPLLAIWEPAAASLIQERISQGYYSPRLLLMEEDALLIDAQDPQALLNANTEEDRRKIQEMIRLWDDA